MEQLRTRFEMALKCKLFNKTNSFNDEEAILLKSLKHFDLYNTGVVDFNGWVKGLEKAGLPMKSNKELKQLFDHYDSQGKGTINYKNFVTSLFARNTDRASNKIGDVQDVLSKMKKKLVNRGVRGLIGLAKTFVQSTQDEEGLVDYETFKHCLLQTQFDYSEEELLKLYARFELAKLGKMNFKAFIDYFCVLLLHDVIGEFE